MALTWENRDRKDQSGKVVSAGYRAQVPNWGEASVHPHIHYPGEMFLDCPSLGIDMHPLGQVTPMDALNPAERALMQALKEHGIRCLEAMTIIGSAEE